MINVSIKNSLSFPKIVFKDDLKHIANRIIIPTMQSNINDQLTLDELPLPTLEPATIKTKLKKGLDPRTLIATGKLRADFITLDNGPYGVKVTIHTERKKIGKYLQIDGIKTKTSRKYFNFFGISTRMENNAMAYMRKRIGEILKSARSSK